MAKDIIDQIKQAEIEAQTIVVESEEQATNIIKKAQEDKAVLLKSCLDEIKTKTNANDNLASDKAFALKESNKAEIQKILEQLDTQYETKKDSAVRAMLEQII